MIDFKNGSIVKLKIAPSSFDKEIAPMLVDGEAIVATFKGVRDGAVFTNKRLITVNVQGVTGAKKDFSSLPYSKLQAFSVETPGALEWGTVDSELELWFSGLGKVRLEFHRGTDIKQLSKIISTYTL